MLRIVVALLAFAFIVSAQAQQAQPPVAPPAKPAAKKSPPKGTPAPQPASPQASGPCVGVISHVGHLFAVKHVGLTVFGNEYKEIPSDDWKLDDVVVARVQAAFGRGFVARRLSYAKGSMDSYSAGGLGFGNAEAAGVLRAAVGSAKCDRYVVVTRAVAQFTGNQKIAGIGIVNTAAFLGRPHVHVVLRIIVHDGRTFEVLKSGMGSTSSLGIILAGAPMREVEGFKWPEKPEATDTPAVRAVARSLLAEVMDKSLPDLLKQEAR